MYFILHQLFLLTFFHLVLHPLFNPHEYPIVYPVTSSLPSFLLPLPPPLSHLLYLPLHHLFFLHRLLNTVTNLSYTPSPLLTCSPPPHQHLPFLLTFFTCSFTTSCPSFLLLTTSPLPTCPPYPSSTPLSSISSLLHCILLFTFFTLCSVSTNLSSSSSVKEMRRGLWRLKRR